MARRQRARALDFQSYVSEQAWWLEDYSLFRALHARERERPWMEWPEALQRRDPPAIDRARRELADEVLFEQYLQWLAGSQWRRARRACPRRRAVRRSAVHGRQRQRRRLGAPAPVPPRYVGRRAARRVQRDRTGLGHAGLPMGARSRAEDYRWLRERARRSADLFDGYRVDHLVGFYRTYGRPEAGGDGFFTPADEPAQRALGETRARAVSRRRRGDHRRGSRHRPRLRARVARAPGRAGLPRVSLGAALARGRDSRSAIRRRIRRSRSRRRARTTPSRWRSGGMRPPESERRLVSELDAVRRLTGGADLARRPFDADRPRRAARGRCSRRRPICCCCRCRTPSAGAIASTSRPPSPT